MGRATTEALVLRRTPFGESSQIAEFFTAEHGRLSLILKGVHRERARKGGGVDLLDHCDITWSCRADSRSLAQLSERRMRCHHPVMRRRIDLLAAGDALVELLSAMAPEGQRAPALFELALAFLDALEADPPQEALASVMFALQGGLLRITGFELVLDRCVSCGRRPEGHRVLRCDPERGGVVCRGCRSGQDHSFDLSAAAARAILLYRTADPRQAAQAALPPRIAQHMKRYYDRVLLHVLERPTRCHVLPRSA